jgi:hypothetical protein
MGRFGNADGWWMVDGRLWMVDCGNGNGMVHGT